MPILAIRSRWLMIDFTIANEDPITIAETATAAGQDSAYPPSRPKRPKSQASRMTFLHS